MAAKKTVSWFDRAIMSVAPKYGAARVRARISTELAARHFEAASTGRRTEGWYRSASDANAATLSALPKLRELSRDLRRNNGWARRAISVIGSQVIGTGIIPKITTVNPALGPVASAIFERWADDTECDFDGRLNYYGLQALAMDTIVESGEVLIQFVVDNATPGIPLRIRVIEPDFLDGTRVEENGNPVRGGIEFDRMTGRRVAYWLFPKHPGERSPIFSSSRTSIRYSADRLAHIYRVERPQQQRGVPWLCAAIASLKDFDDYEDAVLMQQKIAACFAAFVEDSDVLGGGGVGVGEKDARDNRLESIEPGLIEYLEPGKKISFATPPSIPNQETFSSGNLRRIAAAVSISYEDMTGDYTKTNYSSARMARIANWPIVERWRWLMFIPMGCNRVFREAMQVAAVANGWPEIPSAKWSPPALQYLDPDKEGLANQRLVRNGFKTRADVIRENGDDPDRVLAELTEEAAEADAAALVFDSDPRKTTQGGQAQSTGAASASSGAAAAAEPPAEPPTDAVMTDAEREAIIEATLRRLDTGN